VEEYFNNDARSHERQILHSHLNTLEAHNCTKLTDCQLSQASSHQGALSSTLQSIADRWNETATNLRTENTEVTKTAQELQTSFNSGLQSFVEEAQRVSQALVFERISYCLTQMGSDIAGGQGQCMITFRTSIHCQPTHRRTLPPLPPQKKTQNSKPLA
jgi:hypothetical protein